MRSKKYFEGWYFKHVSRDRGAALAVIPGVSFSERGNFCFVQLIDGATGKSRWFPYPLSEFAFSRHAFEISIGSNRFSFQGIELHLSDQDGPVEARLDYRNLTPLAPCLLWPNVMGPYSFAPLMECYHAIGSMDHQITGTARVGSATMDFTGGSGYLEKDWGRSMPSAWIWAQSNTFEEEGASFVFSLARVPWLSRSFPGFFAVLRSGGVVRRFASYTGAVVKRVSLEGRELRIDVEDRHLSLKLRARRTREGTLLAPVHGAMDRRIGESIDACLGIRLEDKKGALIFQGTGVSAGAEVVGNVSGLTPVIGRRGD
jgi:hypothetical protein